MRLSSGTVTRFVAIALLLSAACVASADDSTSVLAQQVDALSERVKALELHVHQLEQQFATSNGATIKMLPAAASVRESWNGIKEGLTKEEVKRILGNPQEQFTVSGKLLWYYAYPGIGAGSVLFADDGRVVGSQEPPRL
jgi:hypothetical protein